MMPDNYVSDMVRDAAKAICRARGIDPDAICSTQQPNMARGFWVYPPEDELAKAWHLCVIDAEAVIRSLRTPTIGMMADAERTVKGGYWSQALEWWDGMLASALKRRGICPVCRGTKYSSQSMHFKVHCVSCGATGLFPNPNRKNVTNG